MHELSRTFRSLRHRNFQLFFAGQLISLVGTWMQNVAQSWLVYRLTGSAELLGVTSFAGQIPVFLLSTLGGAIADRYSRHRIVLLTQAAAMALAFVLAGLTLSGHVQVWHIITLAALLGVVSAFDIPARQALIVELVAREDLSNAVALNSSIFNAARVVGPAVAGLLVAVIGEGWCFFANAASYLAVLAGLLAMTLTPRDAGPRKGSAVEAIREGVRYVRQTQPVLALLLLVGCMSLAAAPYSVLMPIFAADVLHGKASTLGLLMGANGCGALLGALRLASRESLKGSGQLIGWSTVGFGVSLMVFAQSQAIPLSMVSLFVAGVCMILLSASANTLVQAMVPDELRGRVMSLYSTVFMGVAPIGALAAGAAAHRFGAPLAATVGGGVGLIAGFLFLRQLAPWRREARTLVLAQRERLAQRGDPPPAAALPHLEAEEEQVERR